MKSSKRNARIKCIAAESLACIFLVSACTSAAATSDINQNVLSFLYSQENQDSGDVLAAMNSIDDSREAVIEASISVEESIAASIYQSSVEESIFESMSIEQSVAESVSIVESISESESQSVEESIQESVSIEESASIAESIAESQSVAQSIAESQSIEQSIAESMSVAASIQAQQALDAQLSTTAALDISGTVLSEGQVVNASMSDVGMIRKLFANTVVIGDSRAKGIVDCGVLTENEVAYYGGASVGTLYDTTKRAALLMRAKTLFIVGLNDLGWYHGSAERFKADFINLINTYLSINPNSQIYLQEILPVLESGRGYWPMMDYRPAYNNAIKEICIEYGYTFVSANAYALPEYVNSTDGAHYNQTFYLLWAQTIANQMGLWEELK